MAKHYRSSSAQWKVLKPSARGMRKQPTPAERELWGALRGGGVAGVKFRRQHAIGRFIVDFFAAKARLVVEVDGAVHDSQVAENADRESFLRSQGVRMLRVRNEDVLNRLPWVLQTIASQCATDADRSE
jgi:very-short-patch-repair endonuclease